MQKEIWKDIPNYIGIYQVSNLGNVKSLSRVIKRETSNFSVKEKILTPKVCSGGYYQVCLCKENEKHKYIKIHQIVAICFLNHIQDGTQKIVVDHIDNNTKNNKVENLQLISQRENSSKDKKKNKVRTSIYTGVSKSKNNKWRASITIGKKNYNLGEYKCELKAFYIYNKKVISL